MRIARAIVAARNAASSSVALPKQIRKSPSAVSEKESVGPHVLGARHCSCRRCGPARAKRSFDLLQAHQLDPTGNMYRDGWQGTCLRLYSDNSESLEIVTSHHNRCEIDCNAGAIGSQHRRWDRVVLTIFKLLLACNLYTGVGGGNDEVDRRLSDKAARWIAQEPVQCRICHLYFAIICDNPNRDSNAMKHLRQQTLNRCLLLTRIY
jgi:hypothetical protein